MENNKAIIVFFSLEGNSKYAAEKIAGETGADLLQLIPVKAYPKGGFRKFLWGGKSAVMAETPDLEPYEFDGTKYDSVIFVFPVWAGNITPPIRTFIKENDLSGKRIAAVACQSGSGAEKAFQKLRECIGTDVETTLVLIDPKAKPNADNDRKIREFCSSFFPGVQ